MNFKRLKYVFMIFSLLVGPVLYSMNKYCDTAEENQYDGLEKIWYIIQSEENSNLPFYGMSLDKFKLEFLKMSKEGMQLFKEVYTINNWNDYRESYLFKKVSFTGFVKAPLKERKNLSKYWLKQYLSRCDLMTLIYNFNIKSNADPFAIFNAFYMTKKNLLCYIREEIRKVELDNFVKVPQVSGGINKNLEATEKCSFEDN